MHADTREVAGDGTPQAVARWSRRGLTYGASLGVLVILSGKDATALADSYGVGSWHLFAMYALGGIGAGMVYGAFSFLKRSLLGALLLGVLVAAPLSIVVVLGFFGGLPLTTQLLIAVTGALLVGLPNALVVYLISNALEPPDDVHPRNRRRGRTDG